jgi:hypothetical protein
MRCDIKRGTHPEQNLLCSADEFTGMTLFADGEELVIENARDGISVSCIQWESSFTEKKMNV